MKNNQQDISKFNLFQYQQNILPILLGWGTGSSMSGIIWLRGGNQWWRGVGSQFLGWGLINALIAWVGIKNAQKKAKQLQSGEINQIEHKRQTKTFKLILWLNAGLDIGYILGGHKLIQSSKDNLMRSGVGWGIICQGAALFVWDILLARLIQQKKYDS